MTSPIECFSRCWWSQAHFELVNKRDFPTGYTSSDALPDGILPGSQFRVESSPTVTSLCRIFFKNFLRKNPFSDKFLNRRMIVSKRNKFILHLPSHTMYTELNITFLLYLFWLIHMHCSKKRRARKNCSTMMPTNAFVLNNAEKWIKKECLHVLDKWKWRDENSSLGISGIQRFLLVYQVAFQDNKQNVYWWESRYM